MNTHAHKYDTNNLLDMPFLLSFGGKSFKMILYSWLAHIWHQLLFWLQFHIWFRALIIRKSLVGH